MKGLGRKAPDPTSDVQVLRDYLQQFDAILILQGRLITASIPAGQTTVTVTHGLGRAYLGAILTGTNGATAPFAFLPGVASDPNTAIAFAIPSTSAAATSVAFWVF